MRNIKLSIAALAFLFAICSAFTTARKTSNSTYRETSTVDGKVYVQDISNLEEGVDYSCEAQPTQVCKFTTEQSPSLDEQDQMYFNQEDVENFNKEAGEYTPITIP